MTWDLTDGDRWGTGSESPGDEPARAPLWVFVIGRGDARLLAELDAIFGDDPRVQVIEHSDLDRLLRASGQTLDLPALPTSLSPPGRLRLEDAPGPR